MSAQFGKAFLAWHRRWKRRRKRQRRLDQADVVVVSFGKSGRTWLRAMLSHLYHRRYGLPEHELLHGDNLHRMDRRVPRVLFTHDGPQEPWNRDRQRAMRYFKEKRILLLVRDPRDVAVSLYYHTLKRSSPAIRAREGLANGPEALPLFAYMARHNGGKLRKIIGYMNAWARILPSLPRAMRVRYEDLRARPTTTLAEVAAFFDAPADPAEIEAAVAFASLDALRAKERAGFFTGDILRPTDPSDPQSFKVRQGKVGGYRLELTPEQIAEVDTIVATELTPDHGYGAGTGVEPRPRMAG